MSGGPDSLALLLLARAAMPERIEAATVDHGLRPESAHEAAMVAELCAAYGIPHRILTVKVPPGNMQDRARAARYAALAKWMKDRKLGALATAHHADDQAETFLMRLNRGSGVAGLAGVRVRGTVPGTELPLLRPLLGWRREDLAGIIERSGLEAAQDPSNENPKFDRVRIREALKSANWLDVAAVATSASHLAEVESVMQWAAQREWEEAVKVGEGEIRYFPKAPGAIRIRVLARAIGMLGVEPRGGSVALLMRRLLNGKDATLGGVVARVDGNCWTLRKEPPRRIAGMD
ncbi:tRNA lysidine(34) synthetase TilS [Erythrobacter sp. SG61-1L]|uniref:tRNA lysidine(34) synthetase TilS n=1 Tax=Erythrobacter sp. SG61-1L TaxID=1603897 RepID=UPI00240F7D0C|nr:tRNA lysidine(34) synthetase TilS [Erythrobacter sp. SG61-1L]